MWVVKSYKRWVRVLNSIPLCAKPFLFIHKIHSSWTRWFNSPCSDCQIMNIEFNSFPLALGIKGVIIFFPGVLFLPFRVKSMLYPNLGFKKHCFDEYLEFQIFLAGISGKTATFSISEFSFC